MFNVNEASYDFSNMQIKTLFMLHGRWQKVVNNEILAKWSKNMNKYKENKKKNALIQQGVRKSTSPRSMAAIKSTNERKILTNEFKKMTR